MELIKYALLIRTSEWVWELNFANHWHSINSLAQIVSFEWTLLACWCVAYIFTWYFVKCEYTHENLCTIFTIQMKCTAKILFAFLFFHGITQIRNFFRKVSQPWYTNTLTHTAFSWLLHKVIKSSNLPILVSLFYARCTVCGYVSYTCQHRIYDMLQLLHHSTLTSSQFSFQQHNTPKCHREEMMQFC